MKEVLENCQVEWDKGRGVLYVHNKDTGAIVLRLRNLPGCSERCSLINGMMDVRATSAGTTRLPPIT